MRNVVLGRSALCLLTACSLVEVPVAAFAGGVITNRWISSVGGSWTDGANWQDPVNIGTNGIPIFADFSALQPVEEKNGNYAPLVALRKDMTVDLYGLRFGETMGAEVDGTRYDGQIPTWRIGADWTYKLKMPAGNTVTRQGYARFRLHAAPNANRIPFVVRNGFLDLCALWTYAADDRTTIEKSGNGAFRVDPSEGRLAPGILELFEGALYVRAGYDNDGNILPGSNGTFLDTVIRVTDRSWKTLFDVSKGKAYLGALEGYAVDKAFGILPRLGWGRTLVLGGLGRTNTVTEVFDDQAALGHVYLTGESTLKANEFSRFGGVFTVENGDLVMSPGQAFAARVEVCHALNGTICLGGDQAVRRLSGVSPFGTTKLAAGSVLTVGDDSSSDSDFRAALSGDGSLVKLGSAYTLAMSAPSDYTGTTTVSEGTLVTRAECRPTEDLVAWYRFDDPTAPGRDASGNGLDLDIGCLSPSDVQIVEASVQGRTRKVLALNTGVKNDERGYLSLRASAYPACSPRGNDDWSYSIWLKVDPEKYAACTGQLWRPFSYGKAAAFNDRDTSLFIQFMLGESDTLTVPGPPTIKWDYENFGAATREWFHLLVTWHTDADGKATRTIYLNGDVFDEQIGKSPAQDRMKLTTGTDEPFSIGKVNSYYHGWMDELKIWRRALSADEARAEYAGAGETRYVALGDEALSLPEPVADEADLPATNGAVTVSCWVEQGTPLPAAGGAAVSWGSSNGWIDIGYDENGFPGARYCCFTNEYATERTETRFFVENLRLASGAASNPRHHLAYVWEQSPGVAYFYVDGVLQRRELLVRTSNRNPSVRIVPGAFSTGSSVGDPAWTYNGKVEGVKVFAKALSAGEIRRLALLDTRRPLTRALPEATPVTVAANAHLLVDGCHQRIGSLSGAGVVTILSGSDLLTTSTQTFGGLLSGAGYFGAAGGDLAFDPAQAESFTGCLTAEGMGRVVDAGGGATLSYPVGYRNGVVIETSRRCGNLPNLVTSETLHVPEKGTVRFRRKAIGGRTVIARGARVSAPADFSGWKVEADDPKSLRAWKFSVTDDGAFVVDVAVPGFVMLVR